MSHLQAERPGTTGVLSVGWSPSVKYETAQGGAEGIHLASSSSG